jgi:hypothetical protein
MLMLTFYVDLCHKHNEELNGLISSPHIIMVFSGIGLDKACNMFGEMTKGYRIVT